MQVAIITDIHFGVRNGSKFFLDKYQQFFDNIFFPTLIDRNIKTLWVLGDTWEYRTKLESVTLWRAQQMFFDKLRDLEIETYMIYGNHDVAYKNRNDINTIDFLGKMYSNIHVIPKFETIDFDGTPINFISWINNANLDESLKFIAEAPPTVLCGHFEIKSFEMIKGHVCEHGFDKSIFDRYDQVYSGHFHTVSTDGRIFYISNPFQTNWSDYNLDKGFRIFDTTTRDLDFISNPYEVYAKIAYEDSTDIVAFDYEEYRDKIVRVYIQSFSRLNQNKFNLFMEKLNAVVFSADVIEVDETSIIGEDGEIEYVDNHQLIDIYIDDVIQNPNIDKVVLKSMFLDMYNEALMSVETE